MGDDVPLWLWLRLRSGLSYHLRLGLPSFGSSPPHYPGRFRRCVLPHECSGLTFIRQRTQYRPRLAWVPRYVRIAVRIHNRHGTAGLSTDFEHDHDISPPG